MCASGISFSIVSFFSDLSSLCRREPTRAKWVFVPGHQLGNTLAERLARDAGPWANVRFVTPLDVAVRMAGPYLVEAGVDPSDETLGPALIMRLLLAAGDGEPGYFRPMADQPSMADALWATVAELRLAGVTGADLRADALVSPDKHRELVGLLEAYDAHLREHRLADAAIVFREARTRLAFCPIRSSDLRLEWPEAIWPPLVRRFLDALPGERRQPGALVLPRLKQPRRATRWDADVPEPMRASERLVYLMAPERVAGRPVPAGDRSLQIFHAGGREAEIEEICRRVMTSDLPLDDIEIACASDHHAALAWEKAVRLGWNVSSGAGVPATLTRPGRALLGWCDWIENEFSAARLRRLLQSGDVAPRAWREGQETDGAMSSAGQGARLLLRAGPAWGRQTFGPAFARLRAFYRARVGSEERDAEQRRRDGITLKRIDRVESWLADALAAVPGEDGHDPIDLQALVAAARGFLAANAVRASVLDAAALVALDQSLSELASLGAFHATRPVLLRLLRDRVHAQRVGADRPRPGALHISTLSAAGLSGRALLFVAGLEEGRVFPTAIEDPVLLDEERAALSPELQQSGDRLDERVAAVVTRLASIGLEARHGVVLSFSSRDTREFRETFPSWIVLQAFRLLQGSPTLSYKDLSRSLARPSSAVPVSGDTAATDAGWWLAQSRANPVATEAAVLAAYPALARGRDALRRRDAEGFSPWDGFVPAAGDALDITRRRSAVSASTLEDAAACPFRFFLRQGLGVEPLEEGDRQPDAWLDPLTRGRELHDLFAETLRARRDRGQRPDVDDAVAEIRARGVERLAALRHELPPPSEEVFQSERDDFLHDLQLFIEEESRQPHLDPVAFEVSFGLPVDDGAREPLASTEAVTLDLGEGATLRVHGRIDRIDRLPDGSFETLDYKTGKYWPDDWKGTFEGGRHLQHALYGRAAEAMLARLHPGARVQRGTYYFPSARGLRARKEIPTPDHATLSRVLRDLAAVLARGTFVQAPEKSACRFCEFKAACGDEPWERAGRKFALAAELRPYRDLRQHE